MTFRTAMLRCDILPLSNECRHMIELWAENSEDNFRRNKGLSEVTET